MEFEVTLQSFAVALLLCVGAGLATAVGAAVAFFARETNHRLLSIGLSFSAGVMLYVSFVEILAKAHAGLSEQHSARYAGWATIGAFLSGAILTAVIDRLIPTFDNPHDPPGPVDELAVRFDRPTPVPPVVNAARLRRTGLVAAAAIAVHNFPEGMATFLAALQDPKVGVALAVAIALHNVPEGVSVSVPIFYATGNRKKAFWLSALSGLAEPVGALVGFALLLPVLTPGIMGALFASVAGVMVFISLDELIPTAKLYARGHDTVYGIVGGMAVMAASLELMR